MVSRDLKTLTHTIHDTTTHQLYQSRRHAVHGHQHEVKYDDSLRELCRAALRADADVVLFGHTHRPCLEHHLGMEVMNPGVIGRVRQPSYGLLTIEDGKLSAEIRYINS